MNQNIIDRPLTVETLMAQALAMEREAVARYTELAEMMESANNVEVAGLFRKMAQVEGLHVAQILADMGWSGDEVIARSPGNWASMDGGPETIPIDAMHYLMQPWHALNLALAAEQRAVQFFESLAARAQGEAVRRAAEQMRDEEIEHVRLVRSWLDKVPPPDPGWADDPDPPRYDN